MSIVKDKLREWRDKSPLFETLVFTGSVIISGILTSSFVTELTVNNKIQWNKAFNIVPTYLILVFIALLYFYNRFLYKEHLKIKDFQDDLYASAYVKREVYPEVVRDLKKSIREGNYENLKKFEDVIDIRELLSSNKKRGGD